MNLTQSPDISDGAALFVDDDTLVFTSARLQSATQGPNGWINVLELSSGDVRRLTPDDQIALSGDVDPSGRWIVYHASPTNDPDNGAIWFVPVDGSQPPQSLLDTSAQNP